MAGSDSLLGTRLREIRLQRAMTLQETAQRTGVSLSNLSKIERAEVSPSFDVIMRICAGLDVPIEQFVEPGPKREVSGRKTVTHRGEAIPFTSGQYDYLAHATELSRKGMVPLEMWVRARSPDEFSHRGRHAGEEYVFVISGEIEVHTEHYAPFRLRAGESTYFDSAMEHVYVSVGAEDAHLLSVSHDPAAGRGQLLAVMNPATSAADPRTARRISGGRVRRSPSPHRNDQ